MKQIWRYHCRDFDLKVSRRRVRVKVQEYFKRPIARMKGDMHQATHNALSLDSGHDPNKRKQGRHNRTRPLARNVRIPFPSKEDK